MKKYITKKFSCRRQGLVLRGRAWLPVGGQAPFPAVVLCHGFMANQSMMKGYARLAAEMGCAAFTFDFSGGCLWGSSDGKTTDMSVLTEVEDLLAVMEYVGARPYVRKGAVALVGASQGGFAAALAAARRPGQVEKLALLYPAFCIPDDARKGRMMFARFDPENIPPVIRCGPMKLGRCYAASAAALDPYAEILGYSGPVRIIHGDKDTIVDLSYSRRAVKAWQDSRAALGNPARAELVVVPGGGHGFARKQDAVAKEALADFLKNQ